MKKLTLFSALFALLLLAAPNNAQAQVEVDQPVFKLGPRVILDVGDVSDAGGDFGIGADVRIQIPSLPVQGNGSFNYYFTDDPYTIFAIDLNAVYPFGVDNQSFTPYAGGGLGITRVSADINTGFGSVDASDTDIGLNLVGGAEFNAGNVTPFVEGQFTVGGDWNRFGITGGLLFNV